MCTAVASDFPLAKGDGFAIYGHDVDALKEYFSEKGFDTKEEEYLAAFIKMRLFAEEARAVGLIEKLPEGAGPYRFGSVQALYGVYRDYLRHFLENFPVDDQAIVSYYLSYPDRYAPKMPPEEASSMENRREPDEQTRKQIRNQILQAKRTVLVEEEFQRLKRKYHVVVGPGR